MVDKEPKEFIDTNSQTGGDRDKRMAWRSWLLPYRKELRAAKEAGLLPKSGGYSNVVEHQAIVSTGSVFLAKTLKEFSQEVDIETVKIAGFLHDIGKRKDKEAGIQRAEERTKGHTRPLLEKLGYPPDIIETALYTGRVPEIDLPIIDQNEVIAAKPLEHLIVAYVDARVRNTNIFPLEVVRDFNKQKIPANASLYDSWYTFYKNIEAFLEDITGGIFRSELLTDSNVFQMVKSKTS